MTSIIITLSLTALVFWSYSTTTTTLPQIEPFSNRVILIRHGEKGPQSPVPPSLDELVHPTKPVQPHHHSKEGGRQGGRQGRGRGGRVKNSWWPFPPRGPPSGPPGGDKGGRKFPSGLNDAGRQRAQYLRTVSPLPLPICPPSKGHQTMVS